MGSASRIDALFSPDRLRRNWRRAAGEVSVHEKETVAEDTFDACMNSLRMLVTKGFQGSDARVLNRCLDEVALLVEQGNPDAAGAVLDQVEDLAEAYELAGRKQ